MGEEKIYEQEEEIDLRELFSELLKNWILIVAALVLCAIVGFAGTKLFIVPQYEASVNMIVNSRQDTSGGNLTNDNITSAKNLVDTYAIILKSNIVLEEVIASLGLEDTYDELSGRVTVEAVDSTQVMRISVKDPDPARAAEIVEAISNVAPAVLVDALEAGSCKVISKVAASEDPVSPSVGRNTAIAALVGMVLAVGFVVLKYMLQNYIEDDADVQKYLELPVLGVIPEIEEVK